MKIAYALAASALLVSAPTMAKEKTGAPTDFVDAATVCVTALRAGGDPAAKLAEAGWMQSGANPIGTKYSREGTAINVYTSKKLGTQACVVDGFLDQQEKDGLDETIESSLSQTYTDAIEVNRSALGTAFLVGDVLAALTFENRSGGLSTRITAMLMANED
jgi:hypothetical protein